MDNIKSVLFIFICALKLSFGNEFNQITVDCNTLRMGQYLCPDPLYELIDSKTQQIKGCTKENKAKSMCSKQYMNIHNHCFFSSLYCCGWYSMFRKSK